MALFCQKKNCILGDKKSSLGWCVWYSCKLQSRQSGNRFLDFHQLLDTILNYQWRHALSSNHFYNKGDWMEGQVQQQLMEFADTEAFKKEEFIVCFNQGWECSAIDVLAMLLSFIEFFNLEIFVKHKSYVWKKNFWKICHFRHYFVSITTIVTHLQA